MVAVGLTLTRAVGFGTIVDVGVGTLRGTTCKLVAAHLHHGHVILFLYLTLTPVPNSKTVTLHPVVYSLTTKLSECEISPGTI